MSYAYSMAHDHIARSWLPMKIREGRLSMRCLRLQFNRVGAITQAAWFAVLGLRRKGNGKPPRSANVRIARHPGLSGHNQVPGGAMGTSHACWNQLVTSSSL